MKKTDKKRDNAIRQVLTEVCDVACESIAGFTWLTHTVDYARFPQSLHIICIFSEDQQLTSALQSGQHKDLRSSISKALHSIDIPIQDIRKVVSFDTEQACDREHSGNWKKRLHV